MKLTLQCVSQPQGETSSKKLQRRSFNVHMNNKQHFFPQSWKRVTRDSLHTTSYYRSRMLTRHARKISNSILLPKLLTSDAFVFLSFQHF